MKKLYEVLEINENASPDEIKKAFRKLAIQYHPDKNQGDAKAEEKFKEIQQAYEVLSDPVKKQNYDTYGTTDPRPDFGANPFGDMFGGGFDPFEMFRQQAQQQKKFKSDDITISMAVQFDDSIKGKEFDIEINRKEKCSSCQGTGSDDGKTSSCQTCHGTGSIGQSGGFFTINRPCPQCKGSGKIVVNVCKSCNGKKFEVKKKKIHFKLIAGSKDGDKYLIRGEGNQDLDAPGNVIVVLRVSQHEYFKRDGNDIYIDIPISYSQAVMGDKVEIPSLSGKVAISIPSGSNHGKILRLKNAGVNGGNMFVRLNINIPKYDDNIKNILQELEKFDPSSKTPNPIKN